MWCSQTSSEVFCTKQYNYPSERMDQHREVQHRQQNQSWRELGKQRQALEWSRRAPASSEKASVGGSGFHMNKQLALSMKELLTGLGERLWAPRGRSLMGKVRFMAIRAATSIHVVVGCSSGSRTSPGSHAPLHPKGSSWGTGAGSHGHMQTPARVTAQTGPSRQWHQGTGRGSELAAGQLPTLLSITTGHHRRHFPPLRPAFLLSDDHGAAHGFTTGLEIPRVTGG